MKCKTLLICCIVLAISSVAVGQVTQCTVIGRAGGRVQKQCTNVGTDPSSSAPVNGVYICGSSGTGCNAQYYYAVVNGSASILAISNNKGANVFLAVDGNANVAAINAGLAAAPRSPRGAMTVFPEAVGDLIGTAEAVYAAQVYSAYFWPTWADLQTRCQRGDCTQ